jgi:hypothetical protein
MENGLYECNFEELFVLNFPTISKIDFTIDLISIGFHPFDPAFRTLMQDIYNLHSQKQPLECHI